MNTSHHTDVHCLSQIESMSRPQLRRYVEAHQHDRFATMEVIGGRDYATLVDDMLTDYATVRLHLLDCSANALHERVAMYARLADVIRTRIPDDRIRSPARTQRPSHRRG